MSVEDAVRLLRSASVPNPEQDAAALWVHAEVTGVEYDGLVARRAEREPIQRIVGAARFRGLELAVGPGVFLPQPETDIAVDLTLRAIGDRQGLVIVDLCAGSGALGLAVANESPSARVHLVEMSPDAFRWLQRNAAGRGNAEIYLADAADALHDLDGQIDVVTSNPPYVAHHESHHVTPEVAGFDPADAVSAGHDGLDVIRIVEQAAARLLRPGGHVVIEHSDRQGKAVPDLLRSADWVDVQDHNDLSGRPRCATATRP
jgi:release factor glutamine methyltransferase